MPRKPIDYSKTYFYKIVCLDPSIPDCYVGHTTCITTRKANHKFKCITENDKAYNCYVYQFIRDHGGWSNWQIIIIECISCTDSNDASSKERYWLEHLGASLNKQIPTRTREEWELETSYSKHYYDENKNHLLEYNRNYKKENRTYISEYNKNYYQQRKLKQEQQS